MPFEVVARNVRFPLAFYSAADLSDDEVVAEEVPWVVVELGPSSRRRDDGPTTSPTVRTSRVRQRGIRSTQVIWHQLSRREDLRYLRSSEGRRQTS